MAPTRLILGKMKCVWMMDFLKTFSSFILWGRRGNNGFTTLRLNLWSVFPCGLSLSHTACICLCCKSIKLKSRQDRLLLDCHPEWPELGNDQLGRDIQEPSRDVLVEGFLFAVHPECKILVCLVPQHKLCSLSGELKVQTQLLLVFRARRKSCGSQAV